MEEERSTGTIMQALALQYMSHDLLVLGWVVAE